MNSTYSRVLEAASSEPWAILPSSIRKYAAIIEERLVSGKLEDSEVAARVAEQQPYGMSGAGLALGDAEFVALHGPIMNRAGLFAQISGMTSPQAFAARVRALADDEGTRRIVIEIDSPGGSVAGTEEAASAVAYAASKKEVTAIICGMGCSAAYWIASQATTIKALSTSVVGSIGVIATHVDRTAEAEEKGIKVTYLRSRGGKALGQPYEEMDDEVAADWNETISALDAAFYEAVAEGRGITVKEAEEKWGSGGTWIGRDALRVGLVDEVTSIEAFVLSLRPDEEEDESAVNRTLSTNRSANADPTQPNAMNSDQNTNPATEAATDALETQAEERKGLTAEEQLAEAQARIAELEAAAAEREKADAEAEGIEFEALLESSFADGLITAAEKGRLERMESTEAVIDYLTAAAERKASGPLKPLGSEMKSAAAPPLNAVQRALAQYRD